MEGYHSSIFAYGMTSSGKTFTMHGTKEEHGLIPLSIQHVFQYIQSMPTKKFLLRMSYLEVYNEKIVDLLATTAPSQKKQRKSTSTNDRSTPKTTISNTTQLRKKRAIRILNHPTKKNEIIVEGLKEEIVVSADQVLAFVAVGEANRHTGATGLNAHSSRSHTILRLIIESYTAASSSNDNNTTTPIRVSTLSLIDLAGSESVKLTQSTGIRKQVRGFIRHQCVPKLISDRISLMPLVDFCIVGRRVYQS